MRQITKLKLTLGFWYVAFILSALIDVVRRYGWLTIVLTIAGIIAGIYGIRTLSQKLAGASKLASLQRTSASVSPSKPLTEEEIEAMDPVNQRFIRAWQEKNNAKCPLASQMTRASQAGEHK